MPGYAGPDKVKMFAPGKNDDSMSPENEFFYRNKQLFERISVIILNSDRLFSKSTEGIET